MVLEVQAILVLAVLDFQVPQEFQMLQVALDFQVAQLLLEVQFLYRVQSVRSCHPVLFYHRVLSNNQAPIFLRV